jgi:diguanylate cyclase (GGDEF)-like protein
MLPPTNSDTSSRTEIDTTDCENEPIRYPGSIMPHGVLIVLDKEKRTIEAVSDNCAELLRLTPASLLGAPLVNVLELDGVFKATSTDPDAMGRSSPVSINGKEFFARARENSTGHVLIDCEPVTSEEKGPVDLAFSLRPRLSPLYRLSDIRAVSMAVAKLIRESTTFDRVMVYRFDQDWNGEVIGEALEETLEPYAGLCFPASDIPKQARELFKLKGPRQIVDALSIPSTLIATYDSKAIDLGDSDLRSVSPIHIQYMRNMGSRASLVCSLVVDDELWGLVACHHKNGPKYFDPQSREALGWICEDIAIHLGAVQHKIAREQMESLTSRRREVISLLQDGDLRNVVLGKNFEALLNAVNADGFALIIDDEVVTCGITPNTRNILDLKRLHQQREDLPNILATNAISKSFSGIDFDNAIPGALLVRLPLVPNISLIWFRVERRKHVSWAGDPAHPHQKSATGQLTPRTSFEKFIQEITGTSLDWYPNELSSAQELVSVIERTELRHLSLTDPLTRLPNRRAITEKIEEEFQRAQRATFTYAVLMVDIDHFKEINDTYGHAAGDDALRELARVLGLQKRVTDALGRFGGEEFVILLTNTNLAGAIEKAEQLRKAISNIVVQSNDCRFAFTVSIGASAFNEGDRTWSDVVSRADKAMYAAKSSGRNKVIAIEAPTAHEMNL